MYIPSTYSLLSFYRGALASLLLLLSCAFCSPLRAEDYALEPIVQNIVQDTNTEDALGEESHARKMFGWQLHMAYGNTTELAYAGRKIYALSDGSVFSLDIDDEELRTHTALNGLSTFEAGHIVGCAGDRVLIAYRDGTLDILHSDGSVSTITDLARKPLSGVNKLPNDIANYGTKVYLACDFGILLLDLAKQEIAEWFQPEEASNPMLLKVQLEGDTLYASSATTLYAGSVRDNLVDFAAWKKWRLDQRLDVQIPGHITSALRISGCHYQASSAEGIVRLCDGKRTAFRPDGPASNFPYRMTLYIPSEAANATLQGLSMQGGKSPMQGFSMQGGNSSMLGAKAAANGTRIYMVPGGRWTSHYGRPATVMMYEEGEWTNILNAEIMQSSGLQYNNDFTRVAVDPRDPSHFFCSSYGEGLYEFEEGRLKQVYSSDNSPLQSAVEGNPFFVRAEGVAFDREGYLWMTNASNTKVVQVLSPDGRWASLSVGGQTMITPGDVIPDAMRPSYKWVVSARVPAGIGLIDDRGTPLDPSDDRSIFRSTFVDGTGRTITPSEVRCAVQDRNGALWVGTREGVLMIPTSVDFFTSNRCDRRIIKRQDGSELGDYMLGTEQINAIVADGSNRLWIGTAGSGVYLMDIDLFEYDTRTVEHFTQKNSPLPSDHVLSLALNPSGELFVGTTGGLASYQTASSEPSDDYASAYAYPNPVRPQYEGILTITALMENSEVRITDAAGNLVCTTTANGGTATWDLTDGSGKRVRPGVYLIFCNSAAGAEPSGHTEIKVLVM